MSNKSELDPETIYNFVQDTTKPRYGATNPWIELKKIATELYKNSSEKYEEILIGGYEFEGEQFGHEWTQNDRESLGKGVLLYRKKFKDETSKDPGIITEITNSLIIEVWKKEDRVIFIDFRYRDYFGYFGIDNHHGTEKTWFVSGFRVIKIDQSLS